MSSYLNIYLQDRGHKEKHLVASYSRASDIYDAMLDSIGVGYCGQDGNDYTHVTTEDIDNAVKSVQGDVGSMEKRLAELEKHAAGNKEIIDEIIELKSYLEERKALIPILNTYGDIAETCKEDYCDFDGLYMNYD